MPGDYWQKFANLRLLLSYHICQPGKKLIFMGAEMGQWHEWGCKGEIDWGLLQFPSHSGLQRMVKELNQFYLDHPALWERDFHYSGFAWISFDDTQNSVIAYLRKSAQQELLCVHNFTPNYISQYYLRLSNVSTMTEVFNTDEVRYGGSGKVNLSIPIAPGGIVIQVAPLATMVFEVHF